MITFLVFVILNEVRNDAKVNLNYHSEANWIEHVKSLVQQGKFLEIAAAQHEDIVWKSFMFDLKQGTLKFIFCTRHTSYERKLVQVEQKIFR